MVTRCECCLLLCSIIWWEIEVDDCWFVGFAATVSAHFWIRSVWVGIHSWRGWEGWEIWEIWEDVKILWDLRASSSCWVWRMMLAFRYASRKKIHFFQPRTPHSFSANTWQDRDFTLIRHHPLFVFVRSLFLSYIGTLFAFLVSILSVDDLDVSKLAGDWGRVFLSTCSWGY